MTKIFFKSALLLLFAVVICCILYPVTLWVVGQLLFPFQANGSIVLGVDGKPVGSHLIAQSFTTDAYFFPRPSAASYDASASASSALAASNYALRDRVARSLGPLVCYKSSGIAGQKAGPDIETWFERTPHIVSEWASAHNALAISWITSSPAKSAYVENWAKEHPDQLKTFISENPTIQAPTAQDLALFFFKQLSLEEPGKFLSETSRTTGDGKTESIATLVTAGTDIQSVFFDMWREAHPGVLLEDIPGDFVTTSGSGLDPHITLENAKMQLERVATTWSTLLKRDHASVKNEIASIVQKGAFAPLGGLAGEKIVNVLEINLELTRRYGTPY